MTEINIEHLMRELRELDLLCSAVDESDGTGKLRGKLSRLHASVTSLQATGDVSAFREEVRSAKVLVEQLHALEPLTRLLDRLSELERQISQGESRAPER